ncbi:MAG: thiamine phosphate synthase [Terriglobia bacterium]|jgi:thiamine-phosphate pyrophosphorylase
MKNLLLCYITDRRQLRSVSLAAVIRETVRAGVDIVQVREKDLSSRELITLVEEALSATREPGMGGARLVVNDRVDVALAGGADGAHLAAHSMPVQVVRRFVPRAFVIGVSCHSLGEAMAAESGGADYLVLGPVFETPSKLGYGPPLGLEKLRNVTSRIRIPVLALGGITVDRIRPCLEAGASGIAGIRIFQDCESVQERVRELRAQFLEG